jgi:sulfatase maturation enzyme AslB (radical SAM superfamily)
MKCAAFWKHTNIRNDNRIYPCCRFKTPLQAFDGDVEGILHSDEYKALREAKEPIAGCEKCYYEEAQGKTSLRQKFNNEYDTDTVELKFLELGLDNICNLTCDGCFGEFSSAWSKLENPDKPNSYHIRSTKDFNSVPATVDKILFLGGEPLQTKRHYRVLEQLSKEQRSCTEVIYNTNGSFLLSDSDIELLKQFKTVKFILSVDGYNELNEKVRTGSNWGDIIKFIGQIRRLRFDLTIHTVIHLNNWRGIPALEEWLGHMNLDWTTNVLTYPTHLDIRNVVEKDELIKIIKQSSMPNKGFILKHVNN